MKRIAAIFALFVVVTASIADPGLAKDGWIKAQSKHFTLIGNASEKEIRKVGARLEQFRAVFSQLLPPSELNPTIPITVIVFKDDGEYTPFKPLYQGRTSNVSGYFQLSDDAAYITLAADWRKTDPYAVIFHEYVHALTSRRQHKLPVWLDEGIAEFYSGFEVTGGGDGVRLGKPIASHARLLRESRWLSLETLFAVDRASPLYNESEKKNLFYAESWALTHYLLLGDGGKREPQLRRFLDALARDIPAAEAFKESFQTDYATLERELQNYVNRSLWPSHYATLDQKLAFDASIQVSRLGEAEVEAYLGDLLWRIHRSADGEALLQRAISTDPGLASAHYSLGMLRLRQNRYAESKLHFQQAVEANSLNHLAHYYYAFALHREQMDESLYVSEFSAETVKTMRAALNRARELEPNFADTYRLLAFISLVLGEDLDEAANLAKRAMALAPKREDFIYTLAQIQMRQKDYLAAKRTIQPLVAGAAKSDIRQRAKSLLEVIAETEDRMAKTKAEEHLRGDGRSENTSSRAPLPGQRFQGDQIRGFLTRIDCDDESITLTVKSESRFFKLHAAQRGQLIFIRYTSEIPTSITCGALNPAKPVIVTYRNSPLPGFDGEPIGVEFVKQEEK